jgi:hypothetical protein
MRAVSTPSRPVRRPAHAPGQRSWGTRLVRGRPRDPAWARPALLGLLAATAVLYLAGLSRSGYANEFYAAAVQAGTKSWKAFLFGSHRRRDDGLRPDCPEDGLLTVSVPGIRCH